MIYMDHNLERTADFWNNHQHVPSKSKDGEVKDYNN